MPTHTHKPLRLNRNTNPAKDYVLIDARTGDGVARVECHNAGEAMAKAERHATHTGRNVIVALVVGKTTAQRRTDR